jgi:hypothetical protein
MIPIVVWPSACSAAPGNELGHPDSMPSSPDLLSAVTEDRDMSTAGWPVPSCGGIPEHPPGVSCRQVPPLLEAAMVLRTVSGRRDLCLAEPSLGAVQAGVLQAAASPDCYRPYLAQSLDNLARALRQQGLLPLGRPVLMCVKDLGRFPRG